MSISLPKGETNKGKANWSDVYGNDKALKEAGEALEGKFPVTAANIVAALKPVTGYTPKVINTEETRENTALGTLATKDEITGVVVPENGKLLVSFYALAKAAKGGSAALFIGSNQLKLGGPIVAPETQAALLFEASGSRWVPVVSCPIGLVSATSASGGASTVTTGQVIGAHSASESSLAYSLGANPYTFSASVAGAAPGLGGAVEIFVAPGTYTVSVQWASIAGGSITAKERKLWVEVHGY
jgi:hypothetical protein